MRKSRLSDLATHQTAHGRLGNTRCCCCVFSHAPLTRRKHEEEETQWFLLSWLFFRKVAVCFHAPKGEPRTASHLTRRKHSQDARRRNCTSEELNMCPIWIGCFNSSFGIAIPRRGSRLDVFTCQRAGPRATSHAGKTKTVAVGVLAD